MRNPFFLCGPLVNATGLPFTNGEYRCGQLVAAELDEIRLEQIRDLQRALSRLCLRLGNPKQPSFVVEIADCPTVISEQRKLLSGMEARRAQPGPQRRAELVAIGADRDALHRRVFDPGEAGSSYRRSAVVQMARLRWRSPVTTDGDMLSD